jgi:beta-lactamase class A
MRLAVLLLLIAPFAAAAQTSDDPALARLERELSRLSVLGGGRMGVAALHLETGRAVYLNRTERFPMASSFKVPIAVQLLNRVDRGEIRLDSMVALFASQLPRANADH